MFFFFFSSRRRHTRSLRDWSSDVCSSDLVIQARDRERVNRLIGMIDGEILRRQELFRQTGAGDLATYRREHGRSLPAWRSEERRVGKECRARWRPEQ